MNFTSTEKSRNVAKYVSTAGMLCACFMIIHNLDIIKAVLGFAGVREGSTPIAIAIYAILDCAVLYCALKCVERKRRTSTIIIYAALMILFVIPYFLVGDIYGAVQIVVFSGSIVLCGVIISTQEDGYKALVEAFLKVGKVLMIIAIIYVACLFCLSPEKITEDSPLKFIQSYGIIAWLFLPVALVYICRIALDSNFGSKVYAWLVLISLLVAICYTGLRTAYVMIFATFFLVAVASFRRTAFNMKAVLIKLAIIVAIFLCIFQFCTRVVPNMSRLVAFGNNIIYETSSHSSLGSSSSDASPEEFVYPYYMVHDVEKNQNVHIDEVYGRYLMEGDKHRLEVDEMLQNDVKSQTYKYIAPLNEDSRIYAETYTWKTDRINLWNAAIAEFKKSPIFGNGARAFVDKYDGFFPHNMALEILTDFGIVGLIIILALLVVLALSFIERTLRQNNSYRFIFVICALAVVPEYLLYSTIYSDIFLHLSLTVLIFDFIYSRIINKEKCLWRESLFGKEK